MALMALALTPKAQNSIYHHVGDTVSKVLPIYYHQWLPDSVLADSSQSIRSNTIYGSSIKKRDGALLKRDFTDKPMVIKGLAGVVQCIKSHGNHCDTQVGPEYFLLYDATPEGIRRIDSLRWSVYDTGRVLALPIYGQFDNGCDAMERSVWNLKLLEYYFDHPVVVSDSFYVGGTYFQRYHKPWTTDNDVVLEVVVDYRAHGYYNDLGGVHNCTYTPTVHYLSYVQTTLQYSDVVPYELYHGDSHYQMLVFPIIEVCHPIEDLSVDSIQEGRAYLSWSDTTGHSQWQVAYKVATDPTSPEDCPKVETDTTRCILEGLEAGVEYKFYVRGICSIEGDTAHADWVEGEPFSIPEPVGISDAWRAEEGIMLHPNPATRQARLDSGKEILQVECYDMQGKMVAAYTPHSSVLDLDVSEWPRGSYMIRITTEQGTVLRKLMVR